MGLIIGTYILLIIIIVLLVSALVKRETEHEIGVKASIMAPEELRKHASELARNHPVGKSSKSLHWLIRRLNEDYTLILKVNKALSADAKELFPTAPAAEWLLDNFYIIEEQVKIIKRNLSRGQYSRLPVLLKGYLKGYPRVYAIALEMVAHSDGMIDEKSITGFIEAYQSQALLSMGELWAIPLMLRVALIESIRNVCENIKDSQNEWHRAEELVYSLRACKMDERQVSDLMDKQLEGIDKLSPSFVEHLIRKQRKYSIDLSSVNVLVEQRLRKEGTSIKEITAFEHQLQAEMQVSIGNSIIGLRFVSDMDWAVIFEALSKVEQILRQDPCGVYGGMDFESRDEYRHEIERLARLYGSSETNVADKAIECTAEGAGSSPRDHVGYYLVGRGRKKLIDKLYERKGGWRRAHYPRNGRSAALYMSLLIFLTLFFVTFLMYYSSTHSIDHPVVYSILTGIIVLIPCSELSINIINTIASHIFMPKMLPKLELKNGIPQECSTFVIIPTLLTSPVRVNELFRQLEVYYLANREDNLYFALVGDFKDADAEIKPNDQAIISAAVENVKALNEKYQRNNRDIFYFMHRKREYNKRQNRWIGWERKRGAIVEFNRALRGCEDTGFITCTCDVAKLPFVRYVITLDADTCLPMGGAKMLIGAMSHPLNQAVICEDTGMVCEGHGLLQPRIGIEITAANRSFFTKVFAGQGGIDPYTTAISDIYQDMFDEGIFTGKGIYEVDIFRKVLEDRFPNNTVLSHDLLEGCFLRAGLVSDIELVDGYPARYNSYAARQHRWVRGDWQLLPWLSRWVKDKNGVRVKNRLSFISKWKIVDNLRRSLLSPSLMLIFFLGLGILPGSDFAWTAFVLLVAASPLTMGLLNSFLSGSTSLIQGRSNSTAVTGIKAALYQTLFIIMFLPYQAYQMLNAIFITLSRVLITHRNMLEWVTAADVESSIKNNTASYYRRMWFSVPAAVLSLLLAVLSNQKSFYAALPAAIIWLISPYAAFQISKPSVKKYVKLTKEDKILLRRIARKTWRYFEDFAVEEDNFLPPDNYQADPPKGVAHRTSPTNIGMLLLSVLSACDMGYIGIVRMEKWYTDIFETLDKMDKWKGHFFNWYNTITLDIMRPLYISTVDSGNLLGYMITVREGLKGYIARNMPQPSMATGLMDTLLLAAEDAGVKIDETFLTILDTLASAENIDINKWIASLKFAEEWCKENLPGKFHKKSWAYKLSEMLKQYHKEIETFYPFVNQDSLLDRNSDAQLIDELNAPGSMKELVQRYRRVADRLREDSYKHKNKAEIIKRLEGAAGVAYDFENRYIVLIDKLSEFIGQMQFGPLFDNKRQLFYIGYSVDDGHPSKSYYDLLASEARQASYIAIAHNEVERRHWVRLGRKMTIADGSKGLVSWTGTMFEYLMPLLIMKDYENTIFDETYAFVTKIQKRYGKQRHIPWGVSESGYSALDFNLNYQYKAFGVPELGLKRGLADDMVTAPYAVLLAITIDPSAVAENIKRLGNMGMEGDWGYYEAIDFTPSRMDSGSWSKIVKSFMAHHQGMSLAALNNYFNRNILQERFHADPEIKSAELLLQERVPNNAIYTKEHKEEGVVSLKKPEQGTGETIRTFGVPSSYPPEVHILSNGNYSIMITSGGSGYSMYGGMAVTDWSNDYIRNKGFYVFVQNINSNTVWPLTYDPLHEEPEKYKVVFSPDKAEFIRKDGNIESCMEVTVSPEDDAEVRRISITNHSTHTRVIELTSYAEAVMAPMSDYASHPAFSKLFVQTEFIREFGCILVTRRQRRKGQRQQLLLHTMSVEGDAAEGDIQYETDRMKFIGRNRDINDPMALETDQPLSNSDGEVLDPVVSLRRRIRIDPGKTVRVSYAIAIAQTKKQALELAEKYSAYKTAERAFELSWTRSHVEARYLGIDARDVEFYLELVPFLIYVTSIKREFGDQLAKNTGAQPDLWPFGISGDLPIMLVEIKAEDELELAAWALRGHEYWRMRGLIIDLLIIINKNEGYSQPLNDQINNLAAASHARELLDKKGGVYIRNSAMMTSEQLTLLYAAARIIVKDSVELLKRAADKARVIMRQDSEYRSFEQTQVHGYVQYKDLQQSRLAFFNGIGGFSEDGREYIMSIHSGQRTPLPWSNIIANKSFGFLVTESGGGYTWAENSREFKLTPWVNDPVSDKQGEIFYIRDMEDNNCWSLTPMPAGGNLQYIVRHGHGYSVFENEGNGMEQSLTLLTALDSQVKICLICLKNTTKKQKKLAITYYTRPVLGADDSLTAPYIQTRKGKKGLLFIENKYTESFKGRMSFMCTNLSDPSIICDRLALLDVDGSINVSDTNYAGRPDITGSYLDPCASICAKVILEPEAEVEVVFLLGSTLCEDDAYELADKFLKPANVHGELERVKNYWIDKLEAIKVHTPDDSFDMVMNGWLMYQVVACRLWARSAYYQSGGAFGFRDQLQDSVAVVNTWPELTKAQILLHASRQYKEGDVQHWWHAEGGKGIRTKYSDDLLWMVYATAEYIEKTGDMSIIQEQIPFLDGSILKEDEDERYEVPIRSDASGSLYEHCILAIERGLRTGPHGLPLMGGGDWNDGMNTVGNLGKGESVWLGWFILTILKKFIPICRQMEDINRTEKYQQAAEKLIESIENQAWDGSWYRRAYFDNGTPLGSAQNSECKIDSIAQSWSVISGAARYNRMIEAMDAVQKYLINREKGIIKLLTPPFNEGDMQPGYIKAYVPGVRENGGQYTHAAAWVVLAFCELGNGERAGELFHMLNPINHTRSKIEYSIYKAEPYVVAADIYGEPPHSGRGGWTWYTGAAGWLYRIGIENIIGFRKKGDKLFIVPCIPDNWNRFDVEYHFGRSVYHITVNNPHNICNGPVKITVDQVQSEQEYISLYDDGKHHYADVLLCVPNGSQKSNGSGSDDPEGPYSIGLKEGKS